MWSVGIGELMEPLGDEDVARAEENAATQPASPSAALPAVIDEQESVPHNRKTPADGDEAEASDPHTPEGVQPAGAAALDTAIDVVFNEPRLGIVWKLEDHQCLLDRILPGKPASKQKMLRRGLRLTHVAGNPLEHLAAANNMPGIEKLVKECPRPMTLRFQEASMESGNNILRAELGLAAPGSRRKLEHSPEKKESQQTAATEAEAEAEAEA